MRRMFTEMSNIPERPRHIRHIRYAIAPYGFSDQINVAMRPVTPSRR